MKIGILWQPGALWIGAHWSPYCKRWCINIIPCVTLWIMLEGGKVPYSTRPVKVTVRGSGWVGRISETAKRSRIGLHAFGPPPNP